MKQLTSILATGVVLLAGATGSLAQSVTYNDSFGPNSIPFTSTPLATLPQFNPALGTRTSFSLELVATTTAGQITYTDTSGNVSTDVELLDVS